MDNRHIPISKNGINSLNDLCGALYLDYPKDNYNPKIHLSHRWRVKPHDIEEGNEGTLLYRK